MSDARYQWCEEGSAGPGGGWVWVWGSHSDVLTSVKVGGYGKVAVLTALPYPTSQKVGILSRGGEKCYVTRTHATHYTRRGEGDVRDSSPEGMKAPALQMSGQIPRFYGVLWSLQNASCGRGEAILALC